MPITFQNEQTEMPCLNEERVRQWISQVALRHGKRVGEIGYLFCDDRKILEINKQYLNHDYYTDIITFDYSENALISGDIFISIDTVRTNSEKFDTQFDSELHRVIIHGVLHLCGIDDKADGARAVMEQHENEALALLKRLP